MSSKFRSGLGKTRWGSGKTRWGFSKTRWGFGKTRWGFSKTRWGFGKTRWGFGKTRWGFGKCRSGFTLPQIPSRDPEAQRHSRRVLCTRPCGSEKQKAKGQNVRYSLRLGLPLVRNPVQDER